MSILFFEYALKELTRRKSRALLSILGIMFSVALLVGVLQILPLNYFATFSLVIVWFNWTNVSDIRVQAGNDGWMAILERQKL